MSRDPIGERGGVNLYCFNLNRPIDGVDPFGLGPFADFMWDLIIDVWGDEVNEIILGLVPGGVEYIDFGPGEGECEAPLDRVLKKQSIIKQSVQTQQFNFLEGRGSWWADNTYLVGKYVLRLYVCDCPCDVVTFYTEGSGVEAWTGWEFMVTFFERRRWLLEWTDFEYVCDPEGIFHESLGGGE